MEWFGATHHLPISPSTMNFLILLTLAVGFVSCETCVDLKHPKTGLSECAQSAYLCNNPAYYSFMTKQCPKTCGRCTTEDAEMDEATTPTTTTCVDLKNLKTGLSECAQSAYLCNNPAYYSFMTKQCPKTCGRCPSTEK